jgi:hypothetical protein
VQPVAEAAVTRRFRPPENPDATALAEQRACAVLAPRLFQLADDTWALAQRSPALAADPALVRAADHLLAGARRLLAQDPGRRLLPDDFGSGITFHALALALRQVQTALAPVVERHAPPRPRTTADELDDIARLEALVLRGFATNLAERHDIALPDALRPAPPPPPPPAPGRPPAPRQLVRKATLRRKNLRRRDGRVPPTPVPAAAETPASRPLPRIR